MMMALPLKTSWPRRRPSTPASRTITVEAKHGVWASSVYFTSEAPVATCVDGRLRGHDGPREAPLEGVTGA
jgi:hypothetical protein